MPLTARPSPRRRAAGRRRRRRACGGRAPAPRRGSPRDGTSSTSHRDPSGRPAKPRTRHAESACTPTGVWQVAPSAGTTARSASRHAVVRRMADGGATSRRTGCPPAPGPRSRPAPARGRTPRRSARRLPRGGGRAGRARRRRARARRPRRPRACASRVSTLPRSSHDLEVGPRRQQLRAAPQRARPHPRALAHVVERVLADQHVERVGAARRGRPGRSRRRARPARPWPSAPRGRSRRPAARPRARRPSATCRRARGRRRRRW